MGQFNSIEELKNDATIRNLIKESINAIFDMQEEYHENIKEVTNVNTSATMVGDNTVTSGGGVMIGSGKNGITINQNTNLETVMKTMYFGNFLSKRKEPIVQLVSSDMMNMSSKDNSEEEMPNWYDPVYVMGMLGIPVKSAEFDFENKGIKYVVDHGEAKEQVDEANIKEYERMNEEQEEHKKHNEKYAVLREKLLGLKDKLKQLNKEYEALLNDGKGTVKGSDIGAKTNEIQIAQQNLDKDVVDLQNNELVKKAMNEIYDEYGNLTLDETGAEILNKILLNNTIYLETIN